MRVFRLSRRKYAQDLNGKGAAIFGNRWNSKGVEMIYTSASRALAMAEVSVHLALNILPGDYVMLEIEIPEAVAIEELKHSKLDKEWDQFPYSKLTQNIGDKFIESNLNCVIRVPSAVVKGDYNYLINPSHPDKKRVKIIDFADFSFDKRLFE